MGRKFIDCREYPSEMNCTVAFSADSDEELLEVAVQHAVQVHHHKDSPELRQQIRNLFKEGTPPLEAPLRGAAEFRLTLQVVHLAGNGSRITGSEIG